MKDLKDKTVLITGAGRGIGRRMALIFARDGSRLILWDVDKQGIDRVVDEIKEAGGEGVAYECDVSNKNFVYKTAKKVKEEVGPVDILINNAGIVTGKSFLDCSDEQLVKSIEVNIISHFWTLKAFLPDMIERNDGHIVTIASAAGLIGIPGLADYAATKHAAVGFDESIRMELKKRGVDGVQTTCVCPYFINTGMFDGVKQSKLNFLLPILDEKKTALKIVKCIKNNREMLRLPWSVNLLPVARMLPTSSFDWIVRNILGLDQSMDAFKGHGEVREGP